MDNITKWNLIKKNYLWLNWIGCVEIRIGNSWKIRLKRRSFCAWYHWRLRRNRWLQHCWHLQFLFHPKVQCLNEKKADQVNNLYRKSVRFKQKTKITIAWEALIVYFSCFAVWRVLWCEFARFSFTRTRNCFAFNYFSRRNTHVKLVSKYIYE